MDVSGFQERLEACEERVELAGDTVYGLTHAVRSLCELANRAELTDQEGMMLDVYQQQCDDAERLFPKDVPPEPTEATEVQREQLQQASRERRSRREQDKLQRMERFGR